ncbi:THMS2 protein, partial [Nothocercus nigrocapillus]|nr:THMS2 protein [Nothocercus nigrocapillus]
MEPLSLQEYICSLNPNALPRVLRICSGVYFQGSVYEISGNECCLSTGDFLKVIAVKLQKVVCEDVETGQTTELPLTFNGERGRQGSPARSRPPWAPRPPPASGLRPKGPWGTTAALPLHRRLLALGAGPPPQCHGRLRKDVVKIPSTLEVDVEDVTEEAQHVHFIKPLLLSEVLQMEDALPAQAEILEGPSSLGVFKNDWAPRLQKGQRIQIHGKGRAWKVLASARKGTRHFLLSSAYQGRFRRRPREFSTVYEVAASLQAGQPLRVVVTRDCEGQDEDVPSLSVGDRLEARRLLQAAAGSAALLCSRSSSEEEDGEESEELMLPLSLGGSFVEEVCDSKKYRLAEILEQLPLPCDVKVVAKDPSLSRDVLSSFSALRLEARVTEPFLVSSFREEPHESFEVPPRWLDMSLFFTEEPVHPQPPSADCSRVEELNEHFYYHLLKQLPGSSAPPPPRPPKTKEAVGKAGLRTAKGNSPEKAGTRVVSLQPPSLAVPEPSSSQKTRSSSIALSTPNEYTTQPGRHRGSQSSRRPKDKGVENDDSDHDYEVVDEDLQKTVRKMQTVFPF